MSHLRRELGILVAVLLMCGTLWASNGAFLKFSNAGNLLKNSSMLGIFSIGIAFVIITGGIDLSVGTLVGLTGVIIAKTTLSKDDNGFDMPLWEGITIAMLSMLAIGLLQGLLITMLNLQPFIVTLAGMMIFRGISQTICQSGTLSITNDSLQHLANGGFFIQNGSALISWPVVMFAIVIVVFGYLLHFTVFGRYVYAIGGNRDAAKYSGINVKLVETLTYVISAGLAGLAGICYASYIGGMDNKVGQSYELFAITAAVLGGCSLRGGEGTVFGVIVGSLMYQIMYNGINMFQWPFQLFVKTTKGTHLELWHIPTEWTEWIIGGVLLIAVALDQIAHIVQARQRTRKVGQAPTPQPPGVTSVANSAAAIPV
jgi:ribose transport system permease protein